MRPRERRQRVLNIVRERERVSVDLLAKETAASPETIRRDLTELAARGFIRKFHGGATTPNLDTRAANVEGSFQARMREHVQEKRAVARRAAALFEPGETIFIDTGTTTVFFAEELARLSGITVITNSAAIAQAISRGEENRVFLIGGEYKQEAAENVGGLAIEQIGRFRAGHAVLTVGAVEPSGVTDYDLEEAQIAIAMVTQARSVTVLADSSKIGRSGLFTVAPLEAIDRLVTDNLPDDAVAEALASAQVEAILAPIAETSRFYDKIAGEAQGRKHLRTS